MKEIESTVVGEDCVSRKIWIKDDKHMPHAFFLISSTATGHATCFFLHVWAPQLLLRQKSLGIERHETSLSQIILKDDGKVGNTCSRLNMSSFLLNGMVSMATLKALGIVAFYSFRFYYHKKNSSVLAPNGPNLSPPRGILKF